MFPLSAPARTATRRALVCMPRLVRVTLLSVRYLAWVEKNVSCVGSSGRVRGDAGWRVSRFTVAAPIAARECNDSSFPSLFCDLPANLYLLEFTAPLFVFMSLSLCALSGLVWERHGMGRSGGFALQLLLALVRRDKMPRSAARGVKTMYAAGVCGASSVVWRGRRADA
jgi:hypothetical protein